MRLTILAICLLPLMTFAQNPWPSFRGPNGSGLALDGTPPLEWDATTGKNLAYKIKIPGLGHSSPVVWDGKVFVTTAVNPEGGEPYLRTGLFGESPDNPEHFDHEFQVLCFDVKTGQRLWGTTAYKGTPKVQRHVKSSHANSTVATNGSYVVAHFGSEGLYCFDMNGKQIWSKDLGLLDSGAFDVPSIQWGFGSSPVIYDNHVVIQCDVNNQSFVSVLKLENGEEVWRKNREEAPGWGTPTIAPYGDRTQIILNGYHHIGGYDFNSGEELWRMKGGGDIPVPRPILGHDMVFITNAHGRLRPIYAIKLNAKGDISLKEGETQNEFIAWSYPRKGAYLPTPIVHGDYLYIGNDRGVLGCYDAKTGKKQFSQRIGGRGFAYTGSPVATPNHLFFTNEKGVTHVLKPGPSYEQVAANKVGEACLASPAIYGDTFLVRSSKHLFGFRSNTSMTVKNEAASEEPAESKIEKAVTVNVDPQNPATIFQRTNDEASRVTDFSYRIEVKPTGFMTQRLGRIEADVVSSGFVSGVPKFFKIDLKVFSANTEEPKSYVAGCDGDRFYLVDYKNSTIYADFETSVFGSVRGLVFATLMREFYLNDPFLDETKAENYRLGPEVTIDGHPCWNVQFNYAGRTDTETTWIISKKDFLPRGRTDKLTSPDGKPGSIEKRWDHLEIQPTINPNLFQIPNLKEFTQMEGDAP